MMRIHLSPAERRIHGAAILRLGLLALAAILAASRAPAQSACDSCATMPELLGRWHAGGGGAAVAVKLVNGERRVLADKVQRITRETVVQGGRPVQCLHVWYAERGRCRDTVVVNSGTLALRRDAADGKSKPIDIPILPATEYMCDELLETNGPIIGVGGVMSQAVSDPSRRELGPDGVGIGAHLFLGIEIAPEVEAAFAVEAYSISGNLRIPMFGVVRWSPFGKPRIKSLFHYVPDACQFMAPGDAALRAPKSVCRPAGLSGGTDSTVYVVEERWSTPAPFVPFLYAEAGIMRNGSAFTSTGFEPNGFSDSDDAITQYLAGVGVGMPVGGPLAVTLGYRYIRPSIGALVLTAGVEFR